MPDLFDLPFEEDESPQSAVDSPQSAVSSPQSAVDSPQSAAPSRRLFTVTELEQRPEHGQSMLRGSMLNAA